MRGAVVQASVLIVEYASRAFLRECLEALERSHFPRDEFEVIVVDNHSDDGSRELVAARYPQVKLIDTTIPKRSACWRLIGSIRTRRVAGLTNASRVTTS